MKESTNNMDNRSIWKDVLDSIKVSVSSASFNTWFLQTHLIDLKDIGKRYIAEIGCATLYVKSTIERRYFGLIQDTLSKSIDKPCDVTFIVKTNPDLEERISDKDSPLFNQESDSEDIKHIAFNAGLRPNFIFSNFAVSSTNQMAWAAAEAVANNIGHAYNPLFIWGGVGVGKTHLMHAIGYDALTKDNDLKIYCCTGEKFTNDIVEGIRNKTTPAVRQKYRKLKILLIDDVQFIAGKDTVQEEFFHTFNDLVLSGSQVILTSDKPPSEIALLEERLRSRFEAGLIVDIAQPDFELRCAIVQIKSKERGMELPMDMIQLVAGNLQSARKIEGFLVKLSSEVNLKKSELSPELIKNIIEKGGGETSQNGQKIKANPNQVVNAVSKYYSLGKRKLLGTSRARPVARPRQILMYLLRIELSLPLEEVGRLIGGRDHTTVMHAVDKITDLASEDVKIREDIRGIKNLL